MAPITALATDTEQAPDPTNQDLVAAPQPNVDDTTSEGDNTEDELGDSGIPKEIETDLLTCYQFYSREDRATRDIMVAFWRKLENYFNGIQRIFWDYSISDWRRVPLTDDDKATSLIDPTLYDKIINIYRAHGESLIAALSIKLPNVIFYPDDADVTEDIDTAKAYSKIAELITKHNDGILIFIKSLFILFNQGVVAAYIYNRESTEYGTVKVPSYGEDTKVVTHTLICPVCNEVVDQFQTRGDEQVPPQVEVCGSCGVEVEPHDSITEELFPTITGYTDEAKSRTIIDVFGPLYAHMPLYARAQKDMPYINLKFEQHNAMLRDFYPEAIKDKISIRGGSGASNTYDRYARAFNAIQYSELQNQSTVACMWLRPWAFECLGDNDKVAALKKLYPDGVYFEVINDDLLARARPEKLDDHWEITHNPLSNYLHADPMGKPLAPVQEIITEINDLTLDTFEHSIPETFADPLVLDFKKYGESQAKPGMVTPAKPPAGKGLADGFHTLKVATLSKDMDVYDSSMTQKGQFVSGSLPSIWGGANSTGSKTASEYTESRAMAMQRLNITWVMLKTWWAKTIGKGVVIYANSMIADEKIVQKAGNANGFVNIWIKQAELIGNIGSVEPDADETLPMSAEALKAVIMELIPLNNPEVNSALFSPMNTPIISRALGAPNLFIPGEDQRNKQLSEITDILNGIPVMVEPLIDDHPIHIEMIKSWAASPTGIAIKRINQMAYEMITIQHLQDHMMAQQQTMAAPTDTPQGEPADTASGGTAT